jgi:putative ABC transport system permease protein
MKFLPLVWSALWRKPLETVLTWAAATAAFTLFGLMVGLRDHTQHLIDIQRDDRLLTVMRFPDTPFSGLPIAYAEQIARVDGVSAVGATRRLRGYFRDPKNATTVWAADEGMHKAWPEGPLSAAEWQQLSQRPDGVFISRKMADRLGLKAGDVFPMTTASGTRADGNTSWIFQVLGVSADIEEWPEGFVVGSHHYVSSAAPLEKQGLGNMYYIALVNAHTGSALSRAIDNKFANSGTPTYSVPRRANEEALAKSNVDIASVTLGVGGAGLFMILFLVANVIARSVRERVPEFAVLQTLGFRDTHLTGLVLIEAAIPCLLGAILGIALASVLADVPKRFLSRDLARILSSPDVPPAAVAWTLVSALLLAGLCSVGPLLRVRSLSITEALRKR